VRRYRKTKYESRGKLIEAAGTSKGYEIAAIVGIKPAAVSSWKKEKKIPYENLFAVSKYSGVSLHWIVTGEGEKYIQPTSEETETIRALAFSAGVKAEKLTNPTNQAISKELLAMIDAKLDELLRREKELDK
jgi:predicted transcriptional regulator